MNGNDYQKKAVASAGKPFRVAIHGTFYWAACLAGEAGEVINLLKKVIGHGHEFSTERLADELGDALWYIAVCADSAGISLDAIMVHNLDKLEKRYPNGFDSERSINRGS